MEMPDLNHTLLLTIAVLVSLTRLVRLLFVCLRVCVKEYCGFRNWLRTYLARWRKKEIDGSTAGPTCHAQLQRMRKDPALQPGECDCERDQSSQHVTSGASRQPAPTAVQR